jgi:hypothetical protein
VALIVPESFLVDETFGSIFVIDSPTTTTNMLAFGMLLLVSHLGFKNWLAEKVARCCRDMNVET